MKYFFEYGFRFTDNSDDYVVYTNKARSNIQTLIHGIANTFNLPSSDVSVWVVGYNPTTNKTYRKFLMGNKVSSGSVNLYLNN